MCGLVKHYLIYKNKKFRWWATSTLCVITIENCILSLILDPSQFTWPYMHEFISGVFILFHWSVCLFCTHTILFGLLLLCNMVWNQGNSLLIEGQFWVFCNIATGIYHLSSTNLVKRDLRPTTGVIVHWRKWNIKTLGDSPEFMRVPNTNAGFIIIR